MKAVILTFLFTFFGLILIFNLCFAIILSFANLAAVPIVELENLQSDQRVLESFRVNHENKKSRINERFKRKASEVLRMGATGVTLGPGSIIGMLNFFEINEYCEEERELLLEENTLFDKYDSFNFVSCVQSAKRDLYKIQEKVWLRMHETGIEEVSEFGDAKKEGSNQK